MNTFLGHLLHQRLGQARLHCLALGQALSQVSAQAAQLRDAGDDAGLFEQRRQRNHRLPHISNIYVLCANSFVHSKQGIKK